MSSPGRLQIAQVLSASTGGIGRHVAGLLPRLADQGHRVRLFSPALTLQAQDFLAAEAAGVDLLPLGALRPGRGGALAGVDVIHAHGYKAGARALPVARLLGVPLVVTWHNAVLGTGRAALAGRLLQRVVARGADLTLVASSDLVEVAHGAGARRVRLSPVAAPRLDAPLRSRTETRELLGVDDDMVLVLTVSRLAPQKNLGMVLDVAARVADQIAVQLVIVGEGPEREALAARIDHERLPVSLLGHRTDMADLLEAADVALLTSAWEARALVAQEALAAGVPLISTDVGGIPELVGDTAVLVRPGDSRRAAAALVELAERPDLRAALGEAGRRTAAGWPDEDGVAAELAGFYRDLITRNSPG